MLDHLGSSEVLQGAMIGYTTRRHGESVTFPAFVAGTIRRKVAEAELRQAFGGEPPLSVATVHGVRVFFTRDLGNQRDWDEESFRLWRLYVCRVKEA